MEKNSFPTMDRMQGIIEGNRELLKLLYKEHASTHAMALVMYGSAGGYERLVRNLKSDIENARVMPERGLEKSLVMQAQSLREKSASMIKTLESDGVLTPFMVKRIAYKYAENPAFIKSVKGFMHSKIAGMIRAEVRGVW